MGTALFGVFIIIVAAGMVRRDSREKGIPFLPYVGALLLVIAIAVGGVILSVKAQDWWPGKPGQIGTLVGMVATLAACIGSCVWLFTRLKKKYSKS